MQCTRKEHNFQNMLEMIFTKYPLLKNIVQDIHQRGGTSYLVGGAVRDYLLTLPIKDLDIEVHGLSLETLQEILARYGIVNLVGKAFGVLRVSILDIDWSMPRSDKEGRKPVVVVDPHLDIQQAFARRDLTINAMGVDLITGALIDPFHGYEDLQRGILRSPDPTLFIQDPLRFYRVMQFLARFAMKPDEQLNTLCATMDISKVSKERVEVECKKWLLQSRKPSLALDWLDNIKRLDDVFPELAACKGIKQEPKWHPEGDVFEHTKQALDAAASLNYDDDYQKLCIMYAVLCHDLGKVTTTEVIDGVIKSIGHEKISVVLAKKMLKRIMNNQDLIKTVCVLVRYHMAPLSLMQDNAKPAAFKRLANKLAPYATIHMLGLLAMADRLGRNPQKGQPLSGADQEIEQFIQRAQQAEVLYQQEKPILQGRDLMPEVPPGPEMGKLLKKAYQLQITKGIKDKEVLKKQAMLLSKN